MAESFFALQISRFVSDAPVLIALLLLSWLLLFLWTSRNRTRTTAFRGPPSNSLIFGRSRDLVKNAVVNGTLVEEWATSYGSVFQTPSLFRSKDLVLCDPKAIMHVFSRDTFTYNQTPAARFTISHFFGENLLWAEAEDHKRQRRALSPAFGTSAIRSVSHVFYDSVYKLKTSWDASLQNSSKQAFLTDVQEWMNRVSLDSIGIAGFSHNFGSLEGKRPDVAVAFESLGNLKPSAWSMAALVLAPIIPAITKFPTERVKILRKLRSSVQSIATELLQKARAERKAGSSELSADRSIIGALIKSESSVRMSPEEVKAQMLLILAGYETTAISLTWALIELSRHPDMQQKLREELSSFAVEDPTWDQLMNSLPYLDAVMCESLRLHPIGTEVLRHTSADDVIPLSEPIPDARGTPVENVIVAKGTTVRLSVSTINRSTSLWGENALEFCPERWLDGSVMKSKAADIQGYRHILTFGDGPRTCLGKTFATTEFKAVLSVLIRNFSFELPNGPNTGIKTHRSLLVRPKVEGETGARVPLVIRRVE